VLTEYGIREQQGGFDAVGKLEGKFDFCWKWTAVRPSVHFITIHFNDFVVPALKFQLK